eukprot:COSAG02_NODE_3635_length_6446_cov_1.452025_1_plen_54_part_10
MEYTELTEKCSILRGPPRVAVVFFGLVANSIDESTFNQIASKRGAQSKILRLLD